MQHSWIDIDRLIISMAQAGASEEEISKVLIKKYKWSEEEATRNAAPVIRRVRNSKSND